MGKAREQEIRVTAFGLMALVVLASLLAVSAAMVLEKRHLHLPSVSASQDVGGASRTYDAR